MCLSATVDDYMANFGDLGPYQLDEFSQYVDSASSIPESEDIARIQQRASFCVELSADL
jgi:hypothetical protein